MSGNDTLDAFERALAVHGSDPARWPDQVRVMLQDFATRDPEAARLLDEALALERALANEMPRSLERSRALNARILAAARATPQTPAGLAVIKGGKAAALPKQSWLPVGAALAASLALGLLIGAQSPVAERIFGPARSETDAGDLAFGWFDLSKEDVL